MPLIGAAIVPHTPLLLPTVGERYDRQLRRTRRSVEAMALELHALQPDLTILLHPHGEILDQSFAVNVADQMTASFEEFGDMVTKVEFPGHPAFATSIREQAEDTGLPVTLIHAPSLGHDVGVPLKLLFKHRPTMPVVPMAISSLDRSTHLNIGRLIGDVASRSNRRVIVIASVELSQHAGPSAPTGERPEGKTFDASIVKSVGKRRWGDVLQQIDQAQINVAEACGYPVLLMLAGVLAAQNVHARKLSYEAPFGIGLLNVVFHAA